MTAEVKEDRRRYLGRLEDDAWDEAITAATASDLDALEGHCQGNGTSNGKCSS